MGPGRPDARGVGGGVEAALADGCDVGREERDEAFAEAEIGFEDGEVAVVHADDAGTVREGAGDLVSWRFESDIAADYDFSKNKRLE